MNSIQLFILVILGLYHGGGLLAAMSSGDVHTCRYYDEKCTENCTTEKVCDPPEEGKRSHCYTLWTNVSGVITIVKQNCWLDSLPCYQSQCEAKSPSLYFFCCCEGDMCNVNFSYAPVIEAMTTPITTEMPEEVTETDLMVTVLYCLTPITVLASVVAFVYWLYRRCEPRKELPDRPSVTQALLSREAVVEVLPCLPELTGEILARGRFGMVQVARIERQEVAVKTLYPSHKDTHLAWQREQDTYRLPGLATHPHILHFIAAFQHNDQLWLVTQLHRHGCLTDYLKAHVITWRELLTICCSMVEGLAFLHEDTFVSGGQRKPVIAHRDIKSKNVLLKVDGTACIADFGLAMPLRSGRLDNIPQQVGTNRYMSPEVLVGTMSFDVNSFLHVDMYACGLVLWEVMSRCSVEGEGLLDYAPPYDDLVGANPTVADMAAVVCGQNRRPPVHPKWAANEDTCLLVTTLEELWDSDPEARLSASCVLERLKSLLRDDSVIIDMTVLPPGGGSGHNTRLLMERVGALLAGVQQEHTADSGVQSAGEDHTGSGSSDTPQSSSNHC